MNMHHDDAMLEMVAAYALGAIDATTGECAAVRAHLARCPVCRQEFNLARAATAALALSAEEMPPPALRDRIMTALPARLQPRLPSRTAQWFVPVAAAAAVIIAVGLWWSNAHQKPSLSWAANCVSTVQDCRVRGTVSEMGGVLHVQLQGLAALPTGKQYQAWMIPPGGAPKPEPAFSPDQSGGGAVDMSELPVKGAIIAITIEKTGGSQTPTTKPFVVARLD